jgi:hypothetical protein
MPDPIPERTAARLRLVGLRLVPDRIRAACLQRRRAIVEPQLIGYEAFGFAVA